MNTHFDYILNPTFSQFKNSHKMQAFKELDQYFLTYIKFEDLRSNILGKKLLYLFNDIHNDYYKNYLSSEKE